MTFSIERMNLSFSKNMSDYFPNFVKGVMTDKLDQCSSLCRHIARTADIFPDPFMAHLLAVQSHDKDVLTSLRVRLER